MPIRLRRSVLFMPGANTRALDKARRLDVDALIFDLEDAVAPAAKAAARANVIAALREGGYGHRELIVRINALDTPWGREDLAALAGQPMDALLLPKVESAASVVQAAAALDAAGQPELPLWIMAETPRGILQLESIVAASARIAVVVAGTSDLGKELRLPPDPQRRGLVAALSHCILVARAHGLEVLDGVQLNLEDQAAYLAACDQGRALGFDGKTLIHPSQIEAANRVFGPDPAAVARARRIVEAWEDAQRAGRGLVVLDGQLVENLHLDEARRLLALAAAVDCR